ncbi:MAG: RNA 3'-terminal phosphate cyclase [Candidatus Micrarchaeia archaeon]
MIDIDGSHGEGGGQIIRTAMGLSAITGKPITIDRIRANRPNPGLQPQHLMACKAVRSICRGTLGGAEIGSTTLVFQPGPIVGGRYEFDIGTAGSVTLVAQTVMPILLHATKESHVRVIGGTHVMKSPGYDYFEKVFVPAISRMGVRISSKMVRPGYYPKGGGIIEFALTPGRPHGCRSWPAGEGEQVLIRLSGLDKSIAIREKKIFVQNGLEKVYIREDESLSAGNAVTAWNGLRGAYVLGEKGKRAETVAEEALDALGSETGDVDMHLADQLLVYAALAVGGTSYLTSRTSEHLRTNAGIISKFLERRIALDQNRIDVS